MIISQISIHEKIQHLTKRIKELDEAKAELLDEVKALQAFVEVQEKVIPKPVPPVSQFSPNEKIAIFMDLFRGREGVFPKRWENQKTGKSGYSPACQNE